MRDYEPLHRHWTHRLIKLPGSIKINTGGIFMGWGSPCCSGVLGPGKRWAPWSGLRQRWGGRGARAGGTTLAVPLTRGEWDLVADEAARRILV